jgi:hypothetical protein
MSPSRDQRVSSGRKSLREGENIDEKDFFLNSSRSSIRSNYKPFYSKPLVSAPP